MKRLPLTCLLLMPFAAQAAPVDKLPLSAGFYVAHGTSCAEASNATLTLVGGRTFNWPQQACAVQSIEQAGPTTYSVTMDCEATADFPAETLSIKLEIPNDTEYGLSFEAEPPAMSSFCPQDEMPEPWRSNDLSGILK